MKSTRNEVYHKLLKTYRWQRLRSAYMAKHPVCEMCANEGRTSLAKVVHHIVPVEDAKTVDAMKMLAYDPKNLMALCEPCHERIHRELGSRFKSSGHTQRAEAKRIAEDFLKRWCK